MSQEEHLKQFAYMVTGLQRICGLSVSKTV